NGPRDGFHRRKFFLETSVHQIRRLSPQHAQRERSSALHAEESFPTNRAFSDCRSRFADNISPADSGFRGEITIGNPKSEIANAPLAQLAEQVTLNHWVAGSIPARCSLFESLDSNRRQDFRISSTWSCANPSRIVSFPLIVTVLAAYSAS